MQMLKPKIYIFLIFVYVSTYFTLMSLFFQIYVIDSADKKRFEETGLVSLMHCCRFCTQIHSERHHIKIT